MRDILTVILAGGRGSRLEPLTRDRAKPAVPFGGLYRIIDFVLSNCLNSDMRRLLLLTQYKAQSLDRHINLAWRQYFCRELGEFIDVVPPQQRIAGNWYSGTADAVYQNIYAIEREKPEHVVVLAGDHIYKMNYGPMVEFHRKRGADITIGALRVSVEEAKQFGVMQIDPDHRVVGFQEKPDAPIPTPEDPDVCLASMGIYVFSARFLFEALCNDATNMASDHDFGKNVIPGAINSHVVCAYPFMDENRKSDAYWRDVGTIDAYYEASMDLISIDPQLNLYDEHWPVRAFQPNLPPPKFVFGSEGGSTRRGTALDSLVCQGAIVSGGSVSRSILGPGVRVNSYASVEDSILFDDVNVGRRSRLRRVIVDKGVSIPAETEIGFDPAADAARGLKITESGLVVISRGEKIEPSKVAGSVG
ncbi:glucose-1-phosphate adenylyltransferase [Roseiconus lacunae]|uniref:Glucose-1-phosphate adenylyltransferase n=1 Tax=Roseiconus lacunae TaxID=2605694 RepID=A0ABT7PCP4_9BACT|nr:glucose-1-phosphate adenylyltransferase [Roseiconus lacunae]MCD0463151.1 glucose-1-phosphate adenylyltransferase [Roseiconus lacunae]MDM4014123.1 glucose-1-phosphate adenylyltransferase [Roseiconus lacunae]WRQ53423.1 glucose-1-phosphate adenylyltransferase [Stieleria sp. HD01]